MTAPTPPITSPATDRPAPLTPSDCDLSAYDWFPLKHKRLMRSAWWLRASDRAKALNIELWCAAYEEVPAASLPDDDVALSEIAGFGRRDLTAWLAIKDEVMAPWVLCSDGRWYHETLAEVANEAWVSRQEILKAREAERLRKQARKAGAGASRSGGKGEVSGGKDEISGGKSGRSAGGAAEFQRTSGGIPPENALKGQDRTVEEEADASPSDARGRAAGGEEAADAAFEAISQVYAEQVIRGRGSRSGARQAFLALSPDERAAAAAAVKRYAEARPWGSNGPPGLHRFLTDGVWRDFVVSASVTDLVWRGPPELRAAVVSEKDEGFARSYLDPADWRASTGGAPVLVALNAVAVQRLRPLQALRGVSVEAPAERRSA